jgi:hypothetical protein
MSGSIYSHVRRRLAVHSGNDPKALANRTLVILFVQLERAQRSGDFLEVQNAVARIERHLAEIGQRYRVVYAYMYLSLQTLEGLERQHNNAGAGRFALTYTDYYGNRTDRLLISIWAENLFERYRNHFLPACYRDR